MSLNRWLSVILMLGLILALSPLGAQADPYRPFDHQYYHHPHGNAYGWDGPRHRDFDRHRDCYRGPYNHRPYVIKFTPRRRWPIWRPWLPSLGIRLARNPNNPITPSPHPGLHGQSTLAFE